MTKGTLKGKGLAGFTIALCVGALLASATIVPPERVASALRQKASAQMTEDCPAAPKAEAKNTAANRAPQEIKKSTDHPRPDPVRNLLKGILL
jgi:hypothetical protein